MEIKVQVDRPNEPASRMLLLHVERFEAGQHDLLQLLGEIVASNMQENIRTAGGRLGIGWPTLHPVTEKIRQHYGHGASGPKLIRGGDLLHSIRVLDIGKDYVEVGSLLPHAGVLDTGGEWQGRQIQAFPYLDLSDQDQEDLLEAALAFYDIEATAA